MSAEPRLLDVRKNVLKQNDVIARMLRERFRAQGTFIVSLVSSPGAGRGDLRDIAIDLGDRDPPHICDHSQ
jgi:hypothetical protein